MREIFKYGSVGRALRKQCLYPEADRKSQAVWVELCGSQSIMACSSSRN
jgi:hypothetical protein